MGNRRLRREGDPARRGRHRASPTTRRSMSCRSSAARLQTGVGAAAQHGKGRTGRHGPRDRPGWRRNRGSCRARGSPGRRTSWAVDPRAPSAARQARAFGATQTLDPEGPRLSRGGSRAHGRDRLRLRIRHRRQAGHDRGLPACHTRRRDNDAHRRPRAPRTRSTTRPSSSSGAEKKLQGCYPGVLEPPPRVPTAARAVARRPARPRGHGHQATPARGGRRGVRGPPEGRGDSRGSSRSPEAWRIWV